MAKRRGHGEGSIYKRSDGRWEAKASIGYNAEGKPKRITKYFETRKEAQDWLAKVAHEKNIGAFVEPHKTTLGEWLDRWLNDYKKMKIRLTTFESYEMNIRDHIKPAIGNIPLRQLQTSDLQRFYASLLKDGRHDGKGALSVRTVRYIHTILKAALEQAVMEQLLYRNVAKAVELPEEKKKEVVPFTREEIIKFVNHIKDDRLFAAYYLDIKTGLRRGELLGLTWQDIDFENGRLQVRRELVQVKKEGERIKRPLEFQEPKTEKSKRTVPLTKDVIKVLKAHKARQAQEKLFHGQHYQNNDLVFCTEDGKPIWPRNFHRRYTKLLKKAGLPHKKFHALRHTFASLLLEEGEDLKNVQELLGHASIVVTGDIYTHVLERVKKKAVDKLDRIVQVEV
ncbi:MAG: site-specific integrase [Firmicutes bacterium]|nr:site-specific integrase [Bacillota bacterium]